MKPAVFIARQAYALAPFGYGALSLFRDGRILRGPLWYVRELRKFAAAAPDPRFPLRLIDTFPSLYDRYEQSGSLPRHYFHQDLWAARKVFESGVDVHYDFGSRVDGFVAHCLTFCKVTVFDIRPLEHAVENLHVIQTDVTSMTGVESSSLPSVSSLHAIEHVGLGRYGDQIDPRGYEKALRELIRVAAPGASIFLSVPIGRERLEFNSHRIFAPSTIPNLVRDCTLVEFSAVDDQNKFVQDADPRQFESARYACGLYHFKKLAASAPAELRTTPE